MYLGKQIMISYNIEKNLFLQEYLYVLRDSGLGKRRPMHDPDHLERMLHDSNMVVVARQEEEVLGVLRGLRDFLVNCFFIIF